MRVRGFFAALIVTAVPMSVHAQTWPVDAEWRALDCGGTPAFDPLADEPGATNERRDRDIAAGLSAQIEQARDRARGGHEGRRDRRA